MFSVGDALLVGIIGLYGMWALKRLYPKTFASEFYRHIKLANDIKESEQTQDWILVVLQRELDRRGLVGGGTHGAKDATKIAVPALDALTGAEEKRDYSIAVPDDERLDQPHGFSSRAESNVGRAHVAEDGAFAGGLVKDKPRDAVATELLRDS